MRRVAIEGGDVLRGDPSHIVLGKPDEQPARPHGQQPPRPFSVKGLEADFEARLRTIEDQLGDLAKLQQERGLITKALQALKGKQRGRPRKQS